jgi:uncharacterized protein
VHQKANQFPIIRATDILKFKPDPAWFVRPPLGIHGLGHETRVLIWAQVLAAMVREEDLHVDGATLGWAAAIHDTQRLDDGLDSGHGARAASWLAENESIVGARTSIEEIAYLCQWHVPPDRLAPVMTPSLKVFKDADALDRWRIYDLDPAFFRTHSAHRLLQASQDLWASTRSLSQVSSMFEAITDAAIKLGILCE